MKETDDLKWSACEDGFIFMGLEPVTQDDLDALEAYVGGKPLVQESSLVGRWAPQWTATEGSDMGGLGSHTYEVQKVNPSNDGTVEFRPEDQTEIFHYHEGKKVHGIIDYPNTGRSFFRAGGEGTVSGPQPGSEAEEILGDGVYFWHKKNAWWVVV